MTTKNARRFCFVLTHMIFLGMCPTEAPSGSMEIPLADAPDAEEIAFLEELSDWLGTSTLESSLGQTIRERSNSFELFRHYHEEDERYEPLYGLPYGESIRRAAERYDLDGLLLASMVEVESSFDPQARSHRGAVGLMQLLPSTAEGLGREPLSLEDLHDPIVNIDRGARYLRQLLDRFEGDLELALAAYNAGPGNVRRYGGIPPFRETRRYVQKVLSLYVGHHQEVWKGSEAGDLLARG